MFGFPQAPHLPYPCLHGGHLSSYPASGVPAVPSVLHSPPPPGGGKGGGRTVSLFQWAQALLSAGLYTVLSGQEVSSWEWGLAGFCVTHASVCD